MRELFIGQLDKVCINVRPFLLLDLVEAIAEIKQ